MRTEANLDGESIKMPLNDYFSNMKQKRMDTQNATAMNFMKLINHFEGQKDYAKSEAKTKSVYRLKPLNFAKDVFARDNFLPVVDPSQAQGVYMNGCTSQLFNRSYNKSQMERTKMHSITKLDSYSETLGSSKGKPRLLSSIKSKNRMRLDNAIRQDQLPKMSQG
jgi:hypothetical protein